MAGPEQSSRFDQLFAEAAPLITRQLHRREGPLQPDGRWPASIILSPPEPIPALMSEWMGEALEHAGPGHLQTGARGSAHLTVRALEPRQPDRAPTDDVAIEWVRVLREVCAGTAPLRLRFTGVTLTPGTVMAQVEAEDDAAWSFMEELADSLGDLGWYEAQWPPRDIWYVNLVHFAGPIAQPESLVTWVSEHRRVDPVPFVVRTAELVGFTMADRGGRAIIPTTWATEHFTAT